MQHGVENMHSGVYRDIKKDTAVAIPFRCRSRFRSPFERVRRAV